MIRDVKIERLTVSSLGNAVSWSDDGSFAIPNQENVMCIVGIAMFYAFFLLDFNPYHDQSFHRDL